MWLKKVIVPNCKSSLKSTLELDIVKMIMKKINNWVIKQPKINM